MSNERWLEKFNRWNPQGEERTYTISNTKRYCKEFEINNKGLCKHYLGCTLSVKRKTCSGECALRSNI